MPLYEYTARTKDGQAKEGRLTIQSEKELAEHLSSENLILTSAKVVMSSAKKGFFSKFFSNTRVSHIQKIFFTQNLQVMIRTGFSLSNALNTLAIQTPSKGFREIIMEMKQDVESGKTFSD